MTDILMPKLSDTMTEGVFGSWKKNVGDKVTRGDIIAEIETDKAVMELEAFSSGFLLEQRVKPGATVQVGTVIGAIGEKGEQVAEQEAPKEEAPKQLPEHEERPVDHAEQPDSAPSDKQIRKTGKSAPVVRRHAHEMGINIDDVSGSGPDGRVLMEDVERHAADAGTKPTADLEKETAGATPQKEEAARAADESVPLNRMRKAIATTVSTSWSSIPHFYVSIKVQVDKVLELRQEFKKNSLSITLNDIMIKGSALGLEKFPLINASLSGETIQVHHDINIGIMVSVTDGLLAPVIKGCRDMSLVMISRASAELAERAHNGKITEQDMAGGTFSISNLGMFGISRFSAVIMPVQAAILAIGGIMDDFIVADGKVAASKTIEVTLSADHRVVDGAYAAGFLGEFKKIIENPVRLLS